MKKQTTVALVTLCILIIIVELLLSSARGFLMQDTKLDKVLSITNVTATVNGEEKHITLPYSFHPLAPRTPVTITATIAPKADDILYIKSVYSPAKIYTDDKLIYEFGNLKDYPSFMKDPATEVFLMNPQGSGNAITLRMEFLSPVSRDVLTVHPPLMGGMKAVFFNRVHQLAVL